jgi:hypothetical protein
MLIGRKMPDEVFLLVFESQNPRRRTCKAFDTGLNKAYDGSRDAEDPQI